MVFNKDLINNYIQYGQALKAIKPLNMYIIEDMVALGNAVQNLTPKQQALALATKGLTQAEIAQVLTSNQVAEAEIQQALADTSLITQKKQLTKAYALEAITAQGLSSEKAQEIMRSAGIVAANNSEVISKKQVSIATLEAKLAQEGLSATQIKAITTQLGLGASTLTLSNYFKGLAASTWASVKAIGAFLVTNPIGWAILAGTAIAGVVAGIVSYNKHQEELREAAIESANEIDNQSKSLDELKQKYIEICDSADDEKTKNEKLNEIKQELIDVYGFEKDALKELNDERERGLGLLDGEFEKKNRNARNNWLDENKKTINKANMKMGGTGYGVYVASTSNGGIADSVLNFFDKKIMSDNSVTLNFHYEDTVDELERAKKIYEELLEIQSRRSLTKDEKELLKYIKSDVDYLQKLYDDYYEVYSNAAKYNVQNLVENYLATDKGKLENVGKDTFKAWSDGLLNQAENTEQKRIIQDYIAETFPDYSKYFDNLAKAKKQFGVTEPSSDYEARRSAFLEKLSPEDLEIVVNHIPDLFAEGLEGATAKIEAWKADPKNKITADVEVDDADLSTMLETTSKKVKLITTAMEEMNDTGSISSSTYGEIVEMGGNFADCLEIQNGKLKLNVQKLKELERQENLNTIAAKNLAISELNVAAAMAGQSHNAEKVEEIRKQITALEKEKAVLWQINDEIANAKPNESGSGSGSSSSDDPWKEQFDKEYSKKQHLLAMEQLSEEEYLDWLDDAYKKYFSDLTKYQDEYYKYEEEVYKGRKQLAEDYYNNLISDLETQIEVTTKTSESSDGTKLNTQEKFQYIKSIYQELINEVESRINDIVQAGVEGHEDALKELEKQLDEYKEKLSDVFKSAVEEEKDYIENLKDNYSDSYDERIGKIKEQQKAAEEAAQAEIDAVQEKIDALEKANEVEQEANDLIEARQNLEKASQRTRKVYGADGTVTYKNDPQKIKEAQESYNKALLNQQVRLLEDQKDALEKTKDKQSEAYDAIITNLESQKEEGERQFDILLKALDEYLNPDKSTSNVDVWSQLAKMQGVQYKNGVWTDKDGNKINLEELMKSAEIKSDDKKKAETNNNNSKDKDNKSNTAITFEGFLSRMEKTLNLKAGSLTPENVNKIFANSPSMNYNPYEVMKDKTGIANKEYVSNVNNNNNDANVTIGDININNPVGNSSDLAKELMMNLPNAFQNQMYTNLKK